MPLLSLPLPRIPAAEIVEYLPIRVPFPFMRIASILPHAINEPIKNSLMALFRLAWSAKVQIPVLITVVFMACDIRLQLEINIFWETNNARPNALHGSNRNTGGQRRASREDMRRAALVAAALYQQQRRRLIQEMRAQQQTRQQDVARRQSLPLNAPLATEEDSDISEGWSCHESDLLTCSHRSTTSEAGSFGSDEDETEDGEDKDRHVTTKKRKTKRSRPSSREVDEDEEDDDTTTDEDDNDDDDNDDDDDENGSGMNGGSSSHGGAGGGGYRDDTYDNDDSDDMDDSSHANANGGYHSPLVLEIELRHRPLHPSHSETVENCQKSTAQIVKNNSIYFNNLNIFRILCFKEGYKFRSLIGKEDNSMYVTAVPQILL